MNPEIVKYTGSNEGFRSKPYRCTEDKLTIGFGFNLDAGISRELGELILMYQLEEVSRHMKSYSFWQRLNESRKIALTDMCFQLGWNGFTKFKKMISALHKDDYVEASNQVIDSLYARQTPGRAKKNAKIILTGDFKA